MKATVRLDKFLADAGVGTRSEVKKYVRKGLVKVNQVPAKSPEQKIQPEEDEVVFAGQLICPPSEYEYFLLHKPAGCVSATEDKKEKLRR